MSGRPNPAERPDEATRLLSELLRRADRQDATTGDAGKKPLSVRVDYSRARLPTHRDVDALHASLRAAERAEAVRLVPLKGNGHMVERIRLEDADRLASVLGRQRLGVRAAALAAKVAGVIPGVPHWVLDLLDRCVVAWSRGETPWKLSLDQEATALDRFRLLAAISGGAARGQDKRTFSTIAVNDSKVFERQRSPLVAMLREAFELEGLDDDAVLAGFGMVRYPLPVFLSGPAIVSFEHLGLPGSLPGRAGPFVAIQHEWADGLRWDLETGDHGRPGRPAVLMIENLASFHRHVREIQQDGVCVVYTGGQPTPSAVRTLRQLRDALPTPPTFHFWGDVDLGGVRILDYLTRSLEVSVHLHLMDVATVAARGKEGLKFANERLCGRNGSVGDLARRLRDEGLTLEQERIDPAPLATDNTDLELSPDEAWGQ